ncbi:ABC transporter permease [Metabacillus halosaccharovorans]|uniref:ABC transporter permease n=1 Tax=Metabacillus halosaccharovorans TaxID=930124 RepID=UPI00203F315E|nr:ABC-2 family transporter protein [Metabacillus halosaccharovorans]MCM3444728.1 ABC-2 family transporter protein [Metabacillus halosaccharovorans]
MKPFEALLGQILLYLNFLRKNIISKTQYKIDTILLPITVVIRELVSIVALYFILRNFGSLDGWNMEELLLLNSFTFLSYSICVLVFTGVRDFGVIIQQGDFDSYLTKPISPLFYLISKNSDIIATIGHGLVGLLLFSYAYHKVGLAINFKNTIIIIIMLASGVLIQGSILLISATFSFWTVKSFSIQNLLFNQTRSFITYPISIYPEFIQFLLTFVIPFSFVNYFPIKVLIGSVNNYFVIFPPLVGIICFWLSLYFWKYGLRHYSSTGS